MKDKKLLKWIFGNKLRIAIPLQKVTVTPQGKVTEDYDVITGSTLEVVVKSPFNSYDFTPTLSGESTLIIDLPDTLPVGHYAVETLITEPDGTPRRSEWPYVIVIYEDNSHVLTPFEDFPDYADGSLVDASVFYFAEGPVGPQGPQGPVGPMPDVSGFVSAVSQQSFTDPQKTMARNNIGVTAEFVKSAAGTDVTDVVPTPESVHFVDSGNLYNVLKDVDKDFMVNVVYTGEVTSVWAWIEQVNIPAGSQIANVGPTKVNLYAVKDTSSDLKISLMPGTTAIAPYALTWIRGLGVAGSYKIVVWPHGIPSEETPTEGSTLAITSGGVFSTNLHLFDIRTMQYNFTATSSTYRTANKAYTFVSGHRYIGRIVYLDNVDYRTYLSIRNDNQIVLNNICDGTTSRYFDFIAPNADGIYLSVTCAPVHDDNISFFVDIIDVTNNSIIKNIAALGTNDIYNVILQYSDNPIANPSHAKEGWYIKVDGTVGSSSNWYTTGIIELKAGQTLSCVCKGTSTNNTIIALASTNNTATAVYTPVEFGTLTQELHSYSALEDCYVVLQFFAKTGDISIINDSKRLIQIEKGLQDVSSEFEELSERIDNLTYPQYVSDEIDRIYRYLTPLMQTSNLMIAFQTDQHIGGTGLAGNPIYAVHGIKSIVALTSKIPFDYIVLGGDIPGYGTENGPVYNILDDISILAEPLSSVNTRMYSIPGNHDAFQNNNDITSLAMYNSHYKRSLNTEGLVHDGIDNCDSYIDDKDNKVRYIFVDLYTRNSRTESYSTFLSEALAGMDEDYNAIIFSHAPITSEFDGVVKKYSSPDDETGRNAFTNSFSLQNIVNPYADKVIACICGHSHTDAYGVSDSGILYIETTSAVHNRFIFRDGDLIVPYEYRLNSRKETSYDIFVIDMANKTIEAVRYGQGSNRKWRYKGTDVGLISYTNCIYGKASVANATLMFTNSSTQGVKTVTCDSKGYYEIYLKLGQTYNITSNGYTVDPQQIEVLENTELELTLTAEE